MPKLPQKMIRLPAQAHSMLEVLRDRAGTRSWSQALGLAVEFCTSLKYSEEFRLWVQANRYNSLRPEDV